MNETRKWIFHRISAVILTPLFVWFYFSLISLSEKNYNDAIYFFENPLFKTLTIALFFIGFFHVKISLNEIFEDYIQNKKIKDVANILALILSIMIPIIIWNILNSVPNIYFLFLYLFKVFFGTDPKCVNGLVPNLVLLLLPCLVFFAPLDCLVLSINAIQIPLSCFSIQHMNSG